MIEFLVSQGLNPHLATFIAILLGVVATASFGLVWFTIIGLWSERKFAARVQDRIGPNRVGPYGLFQVFADLIKMLTKEDITPEGADKFIYNIAPLMSVAAVVMIWAVMPFAKTLIGADLSVGVIYFVSVASFGTLAVLLAGWSSNNKYALLGALRAVAALVSYEIPMVLAILVPVLLSGTMSLQGITEGQGVWYVLVAPISALIFFTSNLAETGRSPFDLIEAESELVAGYNIEYTGMKFGMFQAAEFIHSYTSCALMAVLFFGGWRGIGSDQANLLGAVLGFTYFFVKSMLIYMLLMLIRNTVPRLRIDQMMDFNWKFLVPLSLVTVLVTALLAKIFTPNYAAAQSAVDAGGALGAFYTALGPRLVAELPRAIALFIANVVILAAVSSIIQQAIQTERRRVEGDIPKPTHISSKSVNTAASGD